LPESQWLWGLNMKPILDPSKIADLKALIGEAKCEAALQRFREELHACLSAIEAHAPDQAEHAHRLAGVAGLLGFEDLEEKSRSFLAASHGDAGDVSSSLASLIDAARRAEGELAMIF
jgi:HPt (histidine-containing phosphotransfer) domain-containing protein